MNKYELILSIFVIFFLQSCVSHKYAGEPALQKEYEKIMASAEIKNCVKNGGNVQSVGILQLPACVIKYPDAGKLCHDKSECNGKCLVRGKSISQGAVVDGKCQETNMPFGCYTQVENGIATMSICVD